MSKKKTKTVEKLLEESLVLEEEQLFNIPSNWCWIKLGSIADIIGGGTPSSKVTEYFEDGEIPWVTPADLSGYKNMYISRGKRNITTLGLSKSSARPIPKDSVLLSSRAPIGYVAIASNELCTNQGFKSFIPSKVIDSRYLYWYLRLSTSYIDSLASGTTFREISGSKCKEIQLPLPPLNEQKRIADKVERLLDKINQAKQLVEEAKETFELRRAAILDKAFRGELTSRWREINYDVESVDTFEMRLKEKITKTREKAVDLLPPYQLPDGWKWIRVKDIALCKSGYAFKSENFIDTGLQLIRMGNLFKHKLNLERNPVFLPHDYDGVIINKYMVKSGDILLSLTGTKYKRDYGYAVRIEEQEDPLLLNQRILSMTPIDISDYFYYYLQSPTFRDMFFSFETGAVNQGNVSSVAVEHIYFPLPPAKEGIEIQNIIESLLEKENNTEELISIEDSLDSLSQTILSKAFRGELGTHDSTEKKAIALLKEVLTNT
jgi:type I restriction enzyme S subunit